MKSFRTNLIGFTALEMISTTGKMYYLMILGSKMYKNSRRKEASGKSSCAFLKARSIL